MRNRSRGITLLEIVVVVLVIALLVAITAPVVAGARRYSQRVVCASNLRQIHAGWTMYLQDYQGSPTDASSWAPRIARIVPYLKDKRVLLCPLDIQGGVFQDSEVQTSYYYFGRSLNETSMSSLLLKAESNPGVFACMLHGRCRFYPPDSAGRLTTPACVGTILRCHLDGSVKTAQFAPRCRYDTEGRYIARAWHFWYLLSDLTCPQEVCGSGWVSCRPEDLHF